MTKKQQKLIEKNLVKLQKELLEAKELKNTITSFFYKLKKKFPSVPYKIEGNAIISRKNFKKHSYKDAPAIISFNPITKFFKKNWGYKRWYKDGELHRENDKPAEIWSNGVKKWYKDNLLHRIKKPAIIKTGGKKEYWQFGEKITA